MKKKGNIAPIYERERRDKKRELTERFNVEQKIHRMKLWELHTFHPLSTYVCHRKIVITVGKKNGPTPCRKIVPGCVDYRIYVMNSVSYLWWLYVYPVWVVGWLLPGSPSKLVQYWPRDPAGFLVPFPKQTRYFGCSPNQQYCPLRSSIVSFAIERNITGFPQDGGRCCIWSRRDQPWKGFCACSTVCVGIHVNRVRLPPLPSAAIPWHASITAQLLFRHKPRIRTTYLLDWNSSVKVFTSLQPDTHRPHVGQYSNDLFYKGSILILRVILYACWWSYVSWKAPPVGSKMDWNSWIPLS